MRERGLLETQFSRDSSDRFGLIASELSRAEGAVTSMAALYAGSMNVVRGEFRASAQTVLAHYSGIHALQWVPVVTAAQRPAHERDGQRGARPDYRITELQGPAADREVYYPVFFVEPYGPSELALGYDLGSEQAPLDALMRARDTGRRSATSWSGQAQETSTQDSILLVQPIFLDTVVTATLQDRRAALEGFIVAVIHIGPIVEQALEQIAAGGLDIWLYDNSTFRRELLYRHASRTRAVGQSSPADPGQAPEGLVERQRHRFADRDWGLVFTPTAAYTQARLTIVPLGTLILGLLFTALMTGYLTTISRRASRVGRVLRESEATVRDLFDNSRDLIQSVGPDGKFRYVNRVWRETLGYDESEIIHLNVQDVITPVDRDRWKKMHAQLMAGEDVGLVEMTLESKSGRRIEVEGSVNCKMSGGVPMHTRGIFRDVTMRKRAETERDKFFNVSLLLLCIAGTDGFFRRLNPTWQRTLGYSLDELYSKPFMEFVHPEDREATNVEIEKLSQGVDTVYFENRYRCKDGSYRWLAWACPAAAPGSDLLYAAARDITELRKAELELRKTKDQAEAANRAKSQFIANMSHELRTPLNAILGYTFLIRREAVGEGWGSLLDDLHRIDAAGNQLLMMINDVLDLSKIEAGRMDLLYEDFDVSEVIESVITTIQPLADARDNELVAHIAPEVGLMCADPTRTRQILLNLLSNACKFTKKGVISVNVRSSVREGSEWMTFEVADTGIGMTPVQMTNIFDEFTQADTSTTRRYGGTGLGLPIARRFCTMMGGRIHVSGALGQGSTFTVELPADLVGPPGTDGAGDVVLVIDDDPTVRDFLHRELSNEGFRVTPCQDTGDPMEEVGGEQPDLILLNTPASPCSDGLQSLRALQEDQSTRNIPVVVVTNRSLTPAELRTLDGNVHRVHDKSDCNHQDLLSTVRSLLPPPSQESKVTHGSHQ